jgi:hypothetical protein
MQPRLKSSKKWTAFPQEYADQIETVFKENFAEHLQGAKLVIEGRIYPEEIALRVGISRPGQLKQPNFEISMDYSQAKKDAVERIHNCIDAAGAMMLDYFENPDEADLPVIWQEFPFQGQKLFLQFTTENTDLETQANALLGVGGEEALVVEEDENEDVDLDVVTAQEEDSEMDEEEGEDADPEDKAPKMFGGKKKKKTDLH